MSQDLGTQETTSVRADFLVELRGFEPLTSVAQTSARLTALPHPVPEGLLPKTRRWIRPSPLSRGLSLSPSGSFSPLQSEKS